MRLSLRLSSVCLVYRSTPRWRRCGQLARMPFHLKEGPQGTGVSFDVQVRCKVFGVIWARRASHPVGLWKSSRGFLSCSPICRAARNQRTSKIPITRMRCVIPSCIPYTYHLIHLRCCLPTCSLPLLRASCSTWFTQLRSLTPSTSTLGQTNRSRSSAR